MNNTGQVTKAKQSGPVGKLANVAPTNGGNNAKQLTNRTGAEPTKSSKEKKKKKKKKQQQQQQQQESSSKGQILSAMAGVTYATIGCQTDRTIDNYGTPSKMIETPSQAPNCNPSAKASDRAEKQPCAAKKVLKEKSMQTNKVCKNQSNQTKKQKEPPQAQANQSQKSLDARYAAKRRQLEANKHKQAQQKPDQATQQQPSQLHQMSSKPKANQAQLVNFDGGQAHSVEASLKVNMTVGAQGKGSPVKKYSHDELLSQMARLDMNNNQPPELVRMQSDGKRILSNISQLELKAELLVNSVPFRMPNS